jgi:hypothetical protein
MGALAGAASGVLTGNEDTNAQNHKILGLHVVAW